MVYWDSNPGPNDGRRRLMDPLSYGSHRGNSILNGSYKTLPKTTIEFTYMEQNKYLLLAFW